MKRRLAVYPLVAVLLCGLVYGGFVYEADADAATLVNSAEILAQCGMFDEAIERGLQALEQEPDHIYAHIILGYAYGQREQFTEAESHYRHAVDASSSESESYSLLRLYHAEMLVKVGRPDEAERIITDILVATPEAYQAYFVLANAHKARGRMSDAALAYREAHAAAPDDPRPLLFLAQLEEDSGKIESAFDLVVEAGELAPDDVRTALYRARLMERRGDRENAVGLLLDVAERKLAAVRDAVKSDEFLARLADDPRIAALFQ
jgi:tetratricopeptide (TPR) repeat protein